MIYFFLRCAICGRSRHALMPHGIWKPHPSCLVLPSNGCWFETVCPNCFPRPANALKPAGDSQDPCNRDQARSQGSVPGE
jgi:hypothetical protein